MTPTDPSIELLVLGLLGALWAVALVGVVCSTVGKIRARRRQRRRNGVPVRLDPRLLRRRR